MQSGVRVKKWENLYFITSKIDEPGTPFSYEQISGSDDDDCISFVKLSNYLLAVAKSPGSQNSVQALNTLELTGKLCFAASKQSDDASTPSSVEQECFRTESGDADDEKEGQNLQAKISPKHANSEQGNFAKKRQAHYNEYYVLKSYRQHKPDNIKPQVSDDSDYNADEEETVDDDEDNNELA